MVNISDTSLIKTFNSLVTPLNEKIKEILLCPSMNRSTSYNKIKLGNQVFYGIHTQFVGFHSSQQLNTRS